MSNQSEDDREHGQNMLALARKGILRYQARDLAYVSAMTEPRTAAIVRARGVQMYRTDSDVVGERLISGYIVSPAELARIEAEAATLDVERLIRAYHSAATDNDTDPAGCEHAPLVECVEWGTEIAAAYLRSNAVLRESEEGQRG